MSGQLPSLGILLVVVSLSAAAAAAPPTVAILPPVLPFAVSRHTRIASGLLELVQATINNNTVAFVERQKIDEILGEQRLMMTLRGDRVLAWGRGLGADLLVLPEFLPTPTANAAANDPATTSGPTVTSWTVRFTIIDPEKASVLSTAEVAARGDCDTGPESLDIEAVAADLAARLTADSKRLVEARGRTPVAVLFFENTTPASDRLDGYGSDLVAGTAAAGDVIGLRMLQFPAVGESRTEQDLAIAGFVAANARWDEIARWWVWGDFAEADWEGRPFAEAGVVVRARVWDGASQPLVIEERGTVADRAGLAKRVATRIAAVIAAGKPTGPPEPPQRLATSLFDQALALQAENVGGEWGVSTAWLERWRRTNRLLLLARFIAPQDRRIALEHVLSRFRSDMVITSHAEATGGTKYLDEPQPLWLLERARAWGEFTARFGFDGEWPASWPSRRNSTADNRAWGFRTVAAQTANAVAGLLGSLAAAPSGSLPIGQGIDPHYGGPWPLDAEIHAELWHEWRGEAEHRARAVLDHGNPQAAITAKSLLALVAALPEQPPVRKPSPPNQKISWPNAWPVKTAATGLVISPPISLGNSEFAPPRPQFDFHAGCVSNGDWLLVGTWRLVGGGGPDSGTVVLQSAGADRAAGRVRRIEQACGLTSGVAGLARDKTQVWLAGVGDGIGCVDLANAAKHDRWSLADGLPVASFSDIDVDPDGVPFAASGPAIEPPRIVWREQGTWLALSVPTFTTEPIRPVARKVACTRQAVVVAGHTAGVSPFAALLDRDTGRWLDLREQLIAHAEAEGLELQNVLQGRKRFNVLDVIASPEGGFVLLHNLGATWIDDAGKPLRTTAWQRRKGFQGRGRGLLSADASRIWFTAATGDYAMAIYELPLQGDGPPTKPRVPRGPFVPMPLCDDGEQLWLPTHETSTGFVDILFLPHGGGDRNTQGVPDAESARSQ